MSEILFLSHRVPFPPDRGDKIRSHHVLKALARIAPVHVGTLGETDDDMAQEGELAALAHSHCFVRRTTPLPVSGVHALIRGEAISLRAFHDSQLRDWVAQTVANRPIDAVYVFSGQMGQYVPDSYTGRLIVDLVDVDSAKFETYAEEARWPRKLVDAREGRLLRREEERLARRANATLLVSEAEAALFRDRFTSADPATVRALKNGIDSTFFTPSSTHGQPELSEERGPHFVFTGQMDYAPNIAAVTRMATEILPRIRQVHSDAMFHIVGRAPTAAVKCLSQQSGVRVWGAVPDMRPFLAAADVVVAPLTLARGVQNKVLEAMAMAKPVLLSPQAATGIDGIDGIHWRVADTDAEFAAVALEMLADPPARAAIGDAARAFVLDNRSWAATLSDLPKLMGFTKRAEPLRNVG